MTLINYSSFPSTHILSFSPISVPFLVCLFVYFSSYVSTSTTPNFTTCKRIQGIVTCVIDHCIMFIEASIIQLLITRLVFLLTSIKHKNSLQCCQHENENLVLISSEFLLLRRCIIIYLLVFYAIYFKLYINNQTKFRLFVLFCHILVNSLSVVEQIHFKLILSSFSQTHKVHLVHI